MLELPSKSARQRYYQFLWKNEMHNENAALRKEQKRLEITERLKILKEEEANTDHLVYGLLRNTMFLRIYDATITHFNNMKLIRSMMFDQKLIIDCSYDEHMNPREASNAAKQMMLCFAENREHDEPFDLHFCNVNPQSIATKVLEKYIPIMHSPEFPINIHTEPMTETFDKKQLVYLTPHCYNDLHEYSHDDIYIIGGMVDKTNSEPLSLAKAKKQGLRMARLPLDKYLQWGAGSGKSLTLNQMVKIMLDMKKHGNWESALKFVPRRKIVDDDQVPFQQSRFNNQQQSQRYGNNREPRFENSREPRFENNRQTRDESNRQPRYENDRQEFPVKLNRYDSSKYFQNLKRNSDQSNLQDDEVRPEQQQRPFTGKRKLSADQKHFDKFRFDLDSWGSKTSNTKKSSGES